MKVLLTTSGTGSRLGNLTKHLNKALIRVGKKPAISYIIELYPLETEFVITLGYRSEQVKDFLELCYPRHKFIFVMVDKYEGLGTSLGYSMLQAKQHLESPFVYHACDTIIYGWQLPRLDENWAAGIKFGNTEQYTSFNVDKNLLITNYNDKGAKNGDYVHIGLVGIKDYQKFWETLERLYQENPNDSRLNDIITFSAMIKQGSKIRGVVVPAWLDIGNPVALAEARARIPDCFKNLDKTDEAVYIFNDYVIKFFADKKKAANRVMRGHLLKGLAPDILGSRKSFYKYDYVSGELYSECVTPRDFKNFLSWAKKNLWKPTEEVSSDQFKKICRDFYETKTKERVNKFFNANNTIDEVSIINGEKILPLSDLLKLLDFNWLSSGAQTQFHGDFILENILKTKEGYCLLDWRQDFGGLLKGGDMYYDLGKLAHNLVVNHDIISRDLFTVNIDGPRVLCKIERKPHLVDCEGVFEKFVVEQGWDFKKVGILRSLIWLNMSPLHHYPFNIFLYYFGKYHLWQALKNQ